MKTQAARNSALALVGLAALAIYILACTSFSPDDKKVLYPAFETNGMISLAVYDRETGRSETVFVPMGYDSAATNRAVPQLLRAEWLEDGKQILAVWHGNDHQENEMMVAILPFGGRGTFRTFHLNGLNDSFSGLVMPPCLSGKYALFQSRSSVVGRLNLKTGEWTTRDFEQDLNLYPAPPGARPFYIQEQTNSTVVFGELDPVQFTLRPLTTFSNTPAEMSFFTYNATGTRLVMVEDREHVPTLVVLDKGKETFARKLGVGDKKESFGNAVLSARGDRVWAAFQREAGAGAGVSFGLMEIPLNSEPIREVVLLKNTDSSDDASAMYFQASVSHDGKTAAVASTYVACTSKEFPAQDCALFLVDLADPKLKFTKVPIPLPPQRANPGK